MESGSDRRFLDCVERLIAGRVARYGDGQQGNMPWGRTVSCGLLKRAFPVGPFRVRLKRS